ncbi:MAG: hypothetical protein L3J46_02155 [Kangiellaceae bacterium]|nr:hypothetical protein [Kangiellaceae bacterium]
MSQWDDKYKEHPVHTTLSSLCDIIENEALISEDVTIIGVVDRIRQVTVYTTTSLQNVIPAIFNNAVLNNISSYLQNIINEVNSYISNKNAGHLNNTTAHVDNLTSQIASLSIPRPKITEKAFSNSALTFKNQVEEIVNEIKKSRDEFVSKVARISSKSTEQESKLQEINNLIEESQITISESISSFHEQFEVFETEYNEKLTKHIEEKDAEVNAAVEVLEEKHNALVSEHEKAATTLLSQLKAKKDEAANLVQIIGNIGVTGNYQKIAIEEKSTANRWRNIALALMLIMVGIIATTVFISVKEGFDWKIAIFRIVAALILGVPAAYAARESAKHRSNETRNRSAELQLASLDPYLEKLPDEKKNQIKENLTEKFFGLESRDTHDSEPVTYNALVDLIKLAIKGKG